MSYYPTNIHTALAKKPWCPAQVSCVCVCMYVCIHVCMYVWNFKHVKQAEMVSI